MARVIYSRPSKTNSQPQRVIAPRKAPRQLPTKAPRTQAANRITKSPRHSPIPADGPSTYYQGAEHYHGAVKFPPPRRNPLRKTRQVKQESEMPSNEPYHELGRKYSQDFKNSEIVTEDEPDWMDLFDDYASDYASVRRFARELAEFKLKSEWKQILKAAKV